MSCHHVTLGNLTRFYPDQTFPLKIHEVPTHFCGAPKQGCCPPLVPIHGLLISIS